MKQTPLAIIGAGPAGMAAAATAAQHGLACVLLDEQAAPGGQIYRAITQQTPARSALLGKDYQAGLSLTQGLNHPLIERQQAASVWHIDQDGTLTYSNGRQQQAEQLKAEQILLATGAQERPFAFRGWTLPGVMSAGAAQILLKAHGLVAKQAILAGNGPLLYLIAQQLIKAGCPPQAILETRAHDAWWQALPHLPKALSGGTTYLWKGIQMLASIKKAGIAHYRGIHDLQALGKDQLHTVQFQHKGKTVSLNSELLLIHQGVIPNTQLSRALRLEHVWQQAQRAWQPQCDAWGVSSQPTVLIAGDGGGISGAKASALSGQLSALHACAHAGLLTASQRDAYAQPLLRKREQEQMIRPFLDALYAPDLRDVLQHDETIVCRCEEVTAGMLRSHVRQGCLGLNQTKAFSRCGMGPCQGRQCGITAAQVLADERGVSMAEIDYYRIRMPIKPVTLSELASLGTPP